MSLTDNGAATEVTALPVPNLPLLRKVLDHIDAHPDEWKQATWGVQMKGSACGTAFCIAGHAAVMSGAEPIWQDASCFEDVRWMANVRLPDGTERAVDEYAAEVLGLTEIDRSPYRQDGGLFAAINTREDVQRVAEAIAARAGERL